MDLKQAQQRLSQDARYRRQYAKHKDRVELVMHSVAIRKQLGISHAELAKELGISTYDISKFENLRDRVNPWVISQIVRRFQKELRECGIQVEKWFVARPTTTEASSGTGSNEGSGRSVSDVSSMLRDRGTTLPTERQRSKDQEEEESEA